MEIIQLKLLDSSIREDKGGVASHSTPISSNNHRENSREVKHGT